MEESKEEREMKTSEEMLELEERIYKRQIELLAEAVAIAESTGTHESIANSMNGKMIVLENLNKLKKMFKREFDSAFSYEWGKPNE